MPALKHAVLRLRSRLAFPALAVAMGLSTLFAGLDHATYLLQATGTQAAVATAQSDTSAPPPAAPSVVAAAVAAITDSGVDTPEAADFDSGISNGRIDSWIKRFPTSLRGD